MQSCSWCWPCRTDGERERKLRVKQAVALEDGDFDAYCAYLHSEAFAEAGVPDGLNEVVKAVKARGRRAAVHGQQTPSLDRDAPSQCLAGNRMPSLCSLYGMQAGGLQINPAVA